MGQRAAVLRNFDHVLLYPVDQERRKGSVGIILSIGGDFHDLVEAHAHRRVGLPNRVEDHFNGRAPAERGSRPRSL